MMLEPLCHTIPGNDIDSTSGLLDKICKVNEKLFGHTDEDLETSTVEEKNSYTAKFEIENNNTRKITKGFEFKEFSENLKLKRIEGLRNLKMKKSHIPNFRAKLWAARLLNEQMKGEKIVLPKDNEQC